MQKERSRRGEPPGPGVEEAREAVPPGVCEDAASSTPGLGWVPAAGRVGCRETP